MVASKLDGTAGTKLDGTAGTKLVAAEELADRQPYGLEYLRAVNMPA